MKVKTRSGKTKNGCCTPKTEGVSKFTDVSMKNAASNNKVQLVV